VTRARAFRILCGGLGGLLVVAGLALVGLFFSYHSAPYRGAEPDLPLPLDSYGVYFAAFAGCGLVGWGGGLLAAVRHAELGRAVGTASAVALVLGALYRIFGWLLGEYPPFAPVLRVEAALFLLLALAFVWLRPPRAAGGA
jgi:hypothetical protein